MNTSEIIPCTNTDWNAQTKNLLQKREGRVDSRKYSLILWKESFTLVPIHQKIFWACEHSIESRFGLESVNIIPYCSSRRTRIKTCVIRPYNCPYAVLSPPNCSGFSKNWRRSRGATFAVPEVTSLTNFLLSTAILP